MKLFLILSLVFLSLTSGAQDSKAISALNYCGEVLPIPEGCSALSEYELECENFSIQWMYLEPDMLTFVPKQYMGQLDDKLKRFKKKAIQVTSMGDDMEAYQVSHREGKTEKYKIIAFGTVNDHPVLINVSLANEINTNEELPEFVRKILVLKE